VRCTWYTSIRHTPMRCMPGEVHAHEAHTANLQMDTPPGYDKLAKAINNDEDPAMFRHFGLSCAKSLLYMQAETKVVSKVLSDGLDH
jgi:hypothetical protein